MLQCASYIPINTQTLRSEPGLQTFGPQKLVFHKFIRKWALKNGDHPRQSKNQMANDDAVFIEISSYLNPSPPKGGCR